MVAAPVTEPVTEPKAGTLAAVGRYLQRRLAEVSTYRGAALLLTALGVAVRPETAEAITAFGLALAGLIGLIFPDRTPAPTLGGGQE